MLHLRLRDALDDDSCALLLGGPRGRARFAICNVSAAGRPQRLVDGGWACPLRLCVPAMSHSGSTSDITAAGVPPPLACQGNRVGAKRHRSGGCNLDRSLSGTADTSTVVTPPPGGGAALTAARPAGSPCSPAPCQLCVHAGARHDDFSDDADSLAAKRPRRSASPGSGALSAPKLASPGGAASGAPNLAAWARLSAQGMCAGSPVGDGSSTPVLAPWALPRKHSVCLLVERSGVPARQGFLGYLVFPAGLLRRPPAEGLDDVPCTTRVAIGFSARMFVRVMCEL